MTKIGIIDADDYWAIRGRPERKSWLAKVRVFAVLFLFVGAGFGGGFWHGKNSWTMTMGQALRVLADAEPKEWESLNAMGAAFRCMKKGASEFSRRVHQEGPTGEDAVTYLFYEAQACLNGLLEAETRRSHSNLVTSYLQDLRRLLR